MKSEFKNVSFTYNKKDQALKNIDLCLENNEIIFILGHTGSGKSTLIQHLNGLLFPSVGEVRIKIGENKFNVDSQEIETPSLFLSLHHLFFSLSYF